MEHDSRLFTAAVSAAATLVLALASGSLPLPTASHAIVFDLAAPSSRKRALARWCVYSCAAAAVLAAAGTRALTHPPTTTHLLALDDRAGEENARQARGAVKEHRLIDCLGAGGRIDPLRLQQVGKEDVEALRAEAGAEPSPKAKFEAKQLKF